jgi:hypothetical protein
VPSATETLIGVVGLIDWPDVGATVTIAARLEADGSGAVLVSVLDGESVGVPDVLAEVLAEVIGEVAGGALLSGGPDVFAPVEQAARTLAETATPAAIVKNLPLCIPGASLLTRSFCLTRRAPPATTRRPHP